MTMTISDAGVTFPDASVQAKSAQGPAFSAYASTQTTLGSTPAKVLFASIDFDTANAYSTALSRFTPQVAGYYLVNAAITSQAGVNAMRATIYKNGAPYKAGVAANGSSTEYCAGVTGIVYLNGSSDFIELWAYMSPTQNTVAVGDSTYFQAALARAA